MDLNSRKRLEFNKRVRDLVSKDRKNLKEKCDKFDKQCAERLAEIQHMQERARFSMRKLEKDKIQLKQAASRRRYSEAASPSLSRHDFEFGVSTQRKAEKGNENIRGFDGLSRSSKKLDIPTTNHSKRRSSAPLSLPQPSSPNMREFGYKTTFSPSTIHDFGRLSISSSLPRDFSTTTRSKHSKAMSTNQNKLTASTLKMSTNDPVVNLRRKSTEDNPRRQIRKYSETSRASRELIPSQLRPEKLPIGRQRSVSVVGPETVKNESRKSSGAGPKGQLFRMRSRSLPDLLSPNRPSERKTGSSSSISSTKNNVNSEVSSSISDDSLARSFEELRKCRYLRSSETSILD